MEALLAQLAVTSVPRECHRKQELRMGYRRSEPFLQKGRYIMGSPQEHKFCDAVMSPVRVQTDLVQVYFFCKAI